MKNLLSLVLFLAFASLTHAAEYPDITLDQVKSAIANKHAVILDANGTKTWKQGHIPGALDFAAVKADLASVLPKDKAALVITYCMCEGCPYYLNAAHAATQLGYTNVKHFAPGIYGWRQSGSPVEKGS
jgi:rhodanese-related sulfurtransferase